MGTPTLTLVRGLPGSGKSTLAQKLRDACGGIHLESDMYFMRDGRYEFVISQIAKAHSWCIKEAERYLRGSTPVVVSNTFVRRSEMAPYALIAETLDAPLQIVEVRGPWTNIHGVGGAVLAKMQATWEDLPPGAVKWWEW